MALSHLEVLVGVICLVIRLARRCRVVRPFLIHSLLIPGHVGYAVFADVPSNRSGVAGVETNTMSMGAFFALAASCAFL